MISMYSVVGCVITRLIMKTQALTTVACVFIIQLIGQVML